MRTSTKILLIVATSLVLLGCAIFTSVMFALDWDFTRLSTSELVTNTHDVSEDINSISVTTDTAKVLFAKSEDGKVSVDCREWEDALHSVTVENGTLRIKVDDNRKWYDHIGINIGTPEITVFLPEGDYGDLSIESVTGSIDIPNIYTFESMDISVTTGKVACRASAFGKMNIETTTGSVTLEDITAADVDVSVTTGKVSVSGAVCGGEMSIDVTTGKTEVTDTMCRSFVSRGSTGDITLKDVGTTRELDIERSTGDVDLDGCYAGEIFTVTDTGDVTGVIRSDMIYYAKSDTGRVEVPRSTVGGRCEISTDTGDIIISQE